MVTVVYFVVVYTVLLFGVDCFGISSVVFMEERDRQVRLWLVLVDHGFTNF